MVDSSLIAQALLKNSLFLYTLLFNHLEIQIIQEPDILYVRSSVDHQTYNNVWKTDCDPQTVDQRIEDIQKIFCSANLPLVWWVDPSDTPADLDCRLEQHGFKFSEQTSIMYRASDVPCLPYDSQIISIKKISTTQELKDFCEVKGGDAVEVAMNNALYCNFIIPHEYPIELFVGYVDQCPVSVAVTVSLDNIGSIHSFATVTSAQGKGYGTQMLRFLLERLYSSGCSMVLLDSSQEGIKLYEKNGFQEVGKYIKGYVLNK